MMRTVYKYNFTIQDEQIIQMPTGYIVRHVGLDPSNKPAIWAEVSTDATLHNTRVFVTGTGFEIPPAPHRHAGSFNDGPFVWHVWI